MLFFIFGGLMMMSRVKQEVFPEFSLDLITISVVYLGAAPQEGEEGVCVRIEEAIQALGPEGLILSPVDNLTLDAPRTWRNAQILIDEWRRSW